MEQFLLVLHIILSFVIVVVILLQSGKGGGLGAGFSSAAAMGQEVFGGRGAAGFLEKLTVVLGASFMITSMALAWYSSKPQSALDLDMEADEPAQAQTHQIIDEGSADNELEEIDVDESMAPGEQPLEMLDGEQPAAPDDEGNLQIDTGDGEPASPEELEEAIELEMEDAEGGEMEIDMEQAPVDDGDGEPEESPDDE